MNYEKVQMTEFEQSVYDLCPVLGIEEAKATASEILELAKKTLLKTGKVVLASNYPEGCSFEDGFHLGYNEGFDACKEQMMKEAVKWLVDDDYDELTDKGGFTLGSVGIGYNGYYIPYSDLLKLPKEDEK